MRPTSQRMLPVAVRHPSQYNFNPAKSFAKQPNQPTNQSNQSPNEAKQQTEQPVSTSSIHEHLLGTRLARLQARLQWALQVEPNTDLARRNPKPLLGTPTRVTYSQADRKFFTGEQYAYTISVVKRKRVEHSGLVRSCKTVCALESSETKGGKDTVEGRKAGRHT